MQKHMLGVSIPAENLEIVKSTFDATVSAHMLLLLVTGQREGHDTMQRKHARWFHGGKSWKYSTSQFFSHENKLH